MLKLNLQFFSNNPIIEKLAIGEEGTYDIYDANALHISDVVQATGTSTIAVMSQKAVTDELKLIEASVAGSSLPEVTETDNGKVLMVVGGSWQANALSTYTGEYEVIE